MMIKRSLFLVFSLVSFTLSARETILKDAEANHKIFGTSLLRYTEQSSVPNYIQFMKASAPVIEALPQWMSIYLNIGNDYGLSEINRTKDELGMEHIRYRQTYKGIPIQGSMYIAHTRNGVLESIGGIAYNDIPNLNMQASLTASSALQVALNKVNAIQYKWQVASEEEGIKQEMNNPSATYFPKAESFILKLNGIYHVCYAFNIYAQEPMSRTIEYVDVANGHIILSKNLIEHINVNGTAVTKFSGTQLFQTDSTAATSFRLHDASRGLGLNTFNMLTGTSYTGSVDFTDADNYWNNVNAAHDEAATDAHWGAQKTYDYYFNKHGRNSIDDAGFALKSYVHYNVNYANAFWDGTRMTYGDGKISSGFLIMTGLDVCGHEITHGLTNFTADLSASSSGSDESDALNEGYSDIFGTAVEKYARPAQWDWIIGADITCTTAGVADGVGIRSMSNPLSMAQPICYQGTNWSASGEPHDNDGPLNYWYYLLSIGSAANNITALGTDTAGLIAYRTLTVHLFPSATYADARFYSIVSSTELYGGCSTPTIATTNAWSTVCVGAPYVAAPAMSSFTGDLLQTCDTTLTVNFTNNSTNGNTFTWYFGDGNTSTQFNPSHTYSSGVYTVKLVVNGGTCGNDSLTQLSYIHVGPPPGPATTGATLCAPGTALLNAVPNNIGDTIKWFPAASGGSNLYTGTNFTTPILSSTTTYYAEEKITAPTYHVGPLNNTAVGAGANYNTVRYQIFDCTAPTILQSVWVLASGAGNRKIVLTNSAGVVIDSIIVNIPTGGSVVTLNMPIPVGTGLQLGAMSVTTAVGINLYRNSAGASYPYTNGPISITGNSAADPVRYYFFYDWVLKGDDCFSVRTPTTVIVATGGGVTPASITPIGSLTVCAPNTVTLNANTGAGFSYQWYNGTTLLSGATSSVYNAAVSGSYSVIVSSSSGCLTPGTSSPAVVSIGTAPSASITPASATSFCQGGSVNLNANVATGFLYQWYLNAGIITGATSASYTATQSGNYTVQVTNANNCSAVSSIVTITVNPLPVTLISPSSSTTFCVGGSVILNTTAGSGMTYQWSLNGTPITGATSSSYTATLAGNYTVLITSSANCAATSIAMTLVVNVLPVPIIINTGGVLSVNGGTFTNYQWYLNGNPISGATNATYSPSQNGTYTVRVTENGCSGLSSGMNLTDVGVHDIAITNNIIISPNPTNDIIHIEGIKPYSISIRNLQGQLIKKAFNKSEISLADFANGIYMMQLHAKDGTLLVNKKIVKQ